MCTHQFEPLNVTQDTQEMGSPRQSFNTVTDQQLALCESLQKDLAINKDAARRSHDELIESRVRNLELKMQIASLESKLHASSAYWMIWNLAVSLDYLDCYLHYAVDIAG